MIIASYLLLGAVAGLVAGVFGLGGGIVIVPTLIFTFTFLNFDPQVLTHLAIGTSLASIIFTSLSAICIHHKHAAIDWSLALKLSIGMFIGGLFGAYVADLISGETLQGIFACYAIFVAIQMWFSLTPKGTYSLPRQLGCTLLGSSIGFISGLFGIAGGSLVVPVLAFYKINISKAIATSSVTGFPIAVSGALGYLWMGRDAVNLPEHTVGYIYWPALVGIVVTSTYFAKVGAKLAHGLNPAILKKLFSVLMVLVATELLFS
ncbi:sulfite exporter TauE/SafE family protein [Psychromonas sp. RZ22]|nr:sulfite exporter TauE/SafE family protein [Psychromonas sp. RZ22]